MGTAQEVEQQTSMHTQLDINEEECTYITATAQM